MRWQRTRRLVCRVRGHRTLAPFTFKAGGILYTVRGCKRCGKNQASQALAGNRAMRRRAARLAKR